MERMLSAVAVAPTSQIRGPLPPIHAVDPIGLVGKAAEGDLIGASLILGRELVLFVARVRFLPRALRARVADLGQDYRFSMALVQRADLTERRLEAFLELFVARMLVGAQRVVEVDANIVEKIPEIGTCSTSLPQFAA